MERRRLLKRRQQTRCRGRLRKHLDVQLKPVSSTSSVASVASAASVASSVASVASVVGGRARRDEDDWPGLRRDRLLRRREASLPQVFVAVEVVAPGCDGWHRRAHARGVGGVERVDSADERCVSSARRYLFFKRRQTCSSKISSTYVSTHQFFFQFPQKVPGHATSRSLSTVPGTILPSGDHKARHRSCR